jgi:hypothetical protein
MAEAKAGQALGSGGGDDASRAFGKVKVAYRARSRVPCQVNRGFDQLEQTMGGSSCG